MALSACRGSGSSEAPETPTATASAPLIVDRTSNPGVASTGFYWLPPIVTSAAAFTTLDQTGTSNGLTVRIDRRYADNATDPAAKATFTGAAITMVTGTSSASFPGVTGPFYGVTWAPGTGVASGQTYRISVAASAPARTLGVADVQVVANATAAAAVDRTKFTPLVVGGTLAIVFRLEAKDSDGDTLNDWRDNCAFTRNVNQLDSNADGIGNACQCLDVPNGTACSTGCKTGETCQSGSCTAGTSVANGSSCVSGNLCKQSETCTSGTCGGGSNRSTGTTCATGNPCKQSETCTSGTCGGGSNKSTGTACTTGNPCKQSETCTSGTCGGGSNKSTGTACTTGNPCKGSQTCSAGVCSTGTNVANGTACSDGNLCTPSDTCQTGICTPGTALACATDTLCHSAGSCARATGACPTIKADATSCSDGNACNGAETCNAAGTCLAGTAPVLTDNNPCTTDACTSASGITHTPVASGTSCTDGNACNGAETCNAAGTCVAGTAPVLTDNNPCTADACSATGGVTHTPVASGTSCSDGNACNGTETCNATGACVAGTAPVLTDNNPCTTDACNATGGVTHTPVASGTSCTDGNACNGTETCNAAGACVVGTAPVLTDNNPCTTDACTAAGGITHTPVASGTSCSDGNACNGAETCNATGTCAAGAGPVLNDNNPCTTDACTPTGGVTHMAVADGTSCQDSDACTEGESCHAGSCVVLAAVACPAPGAITFYQSYQNGNLSDAPCGWTHPQINSPVIPAPGRFGQGMDSSTNFELAYFDPNGTSVPLSKPGSISMWLKADGVYTDASLIDILDDYAGLMMIIADYGLPYGIGADVYFAGPGGVPVVQLAPSFASPIAWQNDGRWHLIVLNWSRDAIGISIDGARSVMTPVGWQPPGHVYGPNVGNLIYTGGGGTGYAKDEVLVLNRPMSDAEIQWYYSQADVTATVNPALAKFGTGPGAGSVWDDLNPCTADSCSAGGGATHGPVAAGISCGDDNACNGAELCNGVGGCQVGPAPALDDSNPCTADSCSFAGGVAHTPVADAGLCSGGTPTVTARFDGFVDVGGGKYVAVFGYDNAGADVTIQPGPQSNGVSRNGAPVAAPTPTPPTQFHPGPHPGTFLPTLSAGETVVWTIAGRAKSATAVNVTPLPHVPNGTGGYGVLVGDDVIPIQADLARWETPPAEPPLARNPPVVDRKLNGTIPTSLNVSPSGAAVYTIPLAIPPGVAGMAPNLSLVYNSQGGDGIAGQGWEMSGLSMIHRCARTREQDGAASPVQLGQLVGPGGTDDEPYATSICLDGKRLFLRQAAFPNYSYESESGDLVEMEYGGNESSSFTLTTKSGEIRSYGSGPLSQVRLNDTEVAWPLDRVADAWGNYYELEYNDGVADFADRGVLVTQIRYTGHLQGTAPDGQTYPTRSAWVNEIDFSYLPRPDVRHVRFGDATLPKNQRLNWIIVGNGIYSFSYADDDVTLPSRLTEVDYCADESGQNCVEPLKFDWDAGGYGWLPQDTFKLPASLEMPYNPNGQAVVSGSQLVDLDGDGRVDFVQARVGLPTSVWRNTGQTFEPAPASWMLPSLAELATSDGSAAWATFADFDGDGLLDIIYAPGGDYYHCSGGFCSGVHEAHKIWLNRLNDPAVHGWQPAPTLESLPAGWPFLDINRRDQVADIDGDGRADIVRFADPGGVEVYNVRVLLNLGPAAGWFEASNNYAHQIAGYRLHDQNRDGLLDLVGKPAMGAGGFGVVLNTGAAIGNVWRNVGGTNPFGKTTYGPSCIDEGDFDGDGVPDSILSCGSATVVGVDTGMAFSTGTGWSSGVASYDLSVSDVVTPSSETGNPLTLPYQRALGQMLQPWHHMSSPLSQLTAIDLNADGLSDVIQAHPSATQSSSEGQLWVNTGTGLQELNGATAWQLSAGPNPVPIYPVAYGPATFVDLDGDGVTDVATHQKAWLNTFRPSVITHFPDGLANKSVVTYKVISTAAGRSNETYADSFAVASGTAHMTPPLRVVASVTSDDGIGSTGETVYQYADLRTSTLGRGPQGFASVTVIGPSGNPTKTTYAQFHPYTGRPIRVEQSVRLHDGNYVTSSVTETHYCDHPVSGPDETPDCTPLGSGTGLQRGHTTAHVTEMPPYAELVRDTTYLVLERNQTNPPTQVTETQFRYDAHLNPLRTTVNTVRGQGYKYLTDTVSKFGSPGSVEEKQGKATMVTVTAQRVGDGSPAIVHKTEFEYTDVQSFGSPGTVYTHALTKRIVERGGALGVELHTAFKHDRYGNVLVTTSCANDFSGCVAGAAGPSESTDPAVPTDPAHLPYRTTTVSYDPADFNAPSGAGLRASLPYYEGWFPVRTTNALGHTEYTAYDQRFGKVVQRTGPNGVHTCYTFDDFGTQTSETARCGSTAPLVTTVEHRLADPHFTPFNYKTVAVTTPPNRDVTWVFSDVRGRQVETRTYGFSASWVQSFTEYDNLGRTYRTSKPVSSGDQPVWKTVLYDEAGRVQQVTDELAEIDGSSTPTTSLLTTTYYAAATKTDHKVRGQTRTRWEIKNELGKLASVADGTGGDVSTMSYAYDAEGNLTTTTDALGNVTSLHYDKRGRKDAMQASDLGAWSYGYDAFGDLIWQQDAKTRTTTMAYDRLGRMVSKKNDDGTAQWLYDAGSHGVGKLAAIVSPPDPRAAGPCAVPFSVLSDGNRAARWFSYNELGELTDAFECADGDPFQTSYQYDTAGRQNIVRYPAVRGERLAIENHYTIPGFLHYVTSVADGKVLWAAEKINAAGQVIQEYTRNGVQTYSQRNRSTGWLMGSGSFARADGDKAIANWSNQYDEAGNLRRRYRADDLDGEPSVESFDYDSLERVTSAEVNIASRSYDSVESYQYDRIGNLKAKAGKAYTYGTCGAGPHAVCQVAGGAAFGYDANGNMLGNSERSLSFDPANKVAQIVSRPTTSQGNDEGIVDFVYGADGNRVLQIAKSLTGTNEARTVYVGLGETGRSRYERTKHNGTTEHVQFIYAGEAHGGDPFALRVVTDDGDSAGSWKYNHVDHLGSVTAVSDETGHVVSGAWGGPDATAMGYDVWGARRNPDGTAASAASFNLPIAHRGFTGHETIPSVGLVNMNGRVYDPALGRFLSPDPTVQFVGDPQSYNRYSYVHNNPLKYTDPTGYALFGLSDESFVGLVTSAIVLGACVANPVACTAVGIALAASNAAVAISNGASVTQVIGSAAISMAISYVGGQAGGQVAAMAGGGAWGEIGGGAVGGMVSSAISSLALDREHLGKNVLMGAVSGAASAAASYANQQLNTVSEVSTMKADGASGDGVDSLDPSAYTTAQKRAFRNEARARALASGEFNDTEVDGVPFRVLGETAVDRGRAIQALRVLETEDGQMLLLTYKNRMSGNDAVEIILTTKGGSFHDPQKENVIAVDIKQMRTKTYSGMFGKGNFTYERVLAHEFGHDAGTVRDLSSLSDGTALRSTSKMRNVDIWENPIMRQLGYFNDRLAY